MNQASPLPTSPLKVHLGCGKRHIPGFLHVDLLAGPHVDHVADVRDLGFLDTGTVDLIYACHVLEHFGRGELAGVLAEWSRVLKPGGVLRLSVPDFAACAKLYYEQGLRDGLTGLIGLISGGQRDEYDFHKIIFDQPFLTTALRAAGFGEVRLWDWRATEHSHIDDFSQAYIPHMDKDNGLLMSLNIEGVKPR
ncbi:MAG: methyltransferase domain-containing protein [Rhodospirillaceae bacterium]